MSAFVNNSVQSDLSRIGRNVS